MTPLPSGTVTFLFTDIEASTRLAQEYPDTWEDLRQRHHAILRSAVEAHAGYTFQVIGDAFCVAFHTAGDALRTALQAQRDLQRETWGAAVICVRMGLHTGKAELQETGDYHGYLTLSRVQRVMSVAHGGQTLVSNPCAELVRGELPEGARLRDMQEHRLKGLLNPERLWQLDAPGLMLDFPALQSLNDIPNNLPLQLTSFIGRENEIAKLKRALNDHRLVTLTGSGGTGKTRLSLQVVAEVLDGFPAGVWFVELAPVSDPGLVPNTLANLLGLRESSETRHSLSELVCGYLRERKALLVFDNCEHLIEAVAAFTDQLLRACKYLKVLASSREALGVAGELAWHVPSLSLPDLRNLPAPEILSQYEAVRLFIERAALVQPRFNVTHENAPAIAQICYRLDGIPLALELAAARANVLSVEQIAKRLDDRFRLLTGGARSALPRQQTLRAMIDWSYNLLAADERLLFLRLAVFSGGWTLEAAESVCSGEGLDAEQVLDLLSQLVRKSLVVMTEQNGEARYHFLETIRQYAREKLFESESAVWLRDRHLDYFITLAEQGYLGVYGPHDLVWIDKLETENDNLRAALGWSLESPEADPQKALQLSGALGDFWDVRGYTREGYQWCAEALKRAPEISSLPRCRALFAAGLLAERISQRAEAIRRIEEALVLARQLKHATLTSLCLLNLTSFFSNGLEDIVRFKEGLDLARASGSQFVLAIGLGWWAIGISNDADETNRYLEEAHQIAEKLGNTRARIYNLRDYGWNETTRDNQTSAAALLQEALRLAQLLKERHQIAHCLLLLGRLATQRGDFETGKDYEDQALQIFRDLSDPSCSVRALFYLGWNAFLMGETPRAQETFDACLAICQENTGARTVFIPLGLGWIALAQKNYAKARGFLSEGLDVLKKRPGSTYILAYFLEAVCNLPDIAPETIARLLGHAQYIREHEAFAIPLSERHLVEPIVAQLKSQLGEETFAAARAVGMALTFQQAIDQALAAIQPALK